jgi:hypothetical protein
MVLPNPVAINYAVYTLFCRQVMENLEDLERAVERDLDLPMEECLRRFNDCLKDFFDKVHPINSAASILLFCGRVTNEAQMMRTGNREAADVFDQVASNANGLAPSWSFQPEITAYHDQGRQLAQVFFNNLSNAAAHTRLAQQAKLEVEYGGSGASNQRADGNLDLGYRVAPMITLLKENKIVLRFTYDHSFALYLLYTFLFLHEYTGHIFSNDLGNRLISDGWLIYAADEFLRWQWLKGNASQGLKREQAFAFRDYFLAKVGGKAREGYDFAHAFKDWLGEHSGVLSFEALTYELATFTPQPSENKWWPTDFFYALRREFYRGDKQALHSKIESARDIRDLYSRLSH